MWLQPRRMARASPMSPPGNIFSHIGENKKRKWDGCKTCQPGGLGDLQRSADDLGSSEGSAESEGPPAVARGAGSPRSWSG